MNPITGTDVDQWLVGAMRSLTGTASVHEAWKHNSPTQPSLHALSAPPSPGRRDPHGRRDGCRPAAAALHPTFATGHVDAAELVTRLEIIEAAGAKPLAADLQQALLRLRRDQDPQTAERAGRLSSPAGRLIARWLNEAPLADPAVEIRWSSSGKVERWLDGGETDDPHSVSLIPSLHAPVTGFPLIDLVFRDPRGWRGHSSDVVGGDVPVAPGGDRHPPAAPSPPSSVDRPVRPSHLRQITRLDGPPDRHVAHPRPHAGNPGMLPEAVDILLRWRAAAI